MSRAVPVLSERDDVAVYRSSGIPGRYRVTVALERGGPMPLTVGPHAVACEHPTSLKSLADCVDAIRETRADMIRALMEGII